MFSAIKRVIKTGYGNFLRNSGLTIATVFSIVIVVGLITILFLFNSVSKILISDLREKIDISVYFKKEVLMDDILELKTVLSKIPEVKNVEYVSREEALDKFVGNHKNDPVLMASLTEVGENPFLASLSIRAWQASQYGQVVKFLENGSFKGLIKEVDYYQRKPVIEKVFSLASAMNKGGLIFVLILGLIAFLIAFNGIRIAILNTSEEISVMKLVGASNWFIRGPFLIQGALAGVLAVLIVIVFAFGAVYVFDSKFRALTSLSVFDLFVGNFWVILLLQLFVGIGLGVFSSAMAIRKYLKV